MGNKLTQTDARGNVTRWAYDNLGRVISHRLPLGGSESFTYDANGNVLTRTDFDGQTTRFRYDVSDRLIQKTYPDGTQVAFTYTATGQRASATDARGVISYTYDQRDRPTSVIDPNGAISYTYDAKGNRITVTVPSGATQFGFDALNRLSTVTDRSGRATTYTYDNVGNRQAVANLNGTTTQYTYDSLNRLTALLNRQSTSGSILSSYTYTLGAAGNRTRVAENSGRAVSYTYDAVQRLTAETITDPVNGNRTLAYTYDNVGNRLTKVDPLGTTTYTYDANDRLLGDGSTSFTYDNNGSTLTAVGGTATTRYSYDFENHLIGATGPSGSTTTFSYDVDGIRTRSATGSAVTNYLVDKNRDFAEVLEERDGSGTLVAGYTYGDQLISQTRGGASSFYLYDGLGSTRVLADATVTVTDTYTYEAFGNLLASTRTTANNHLFAGQRFDPNVGFYYLRARFLNPQMGRFITDDPHEGSIFDPSSLHKYLYVSADPVNQVDPSGLQELVEIAVTAAIIGVMAGIATYSLTGSVQLAIIVGVSVMVLSFIVLGGVAALLNAIGVGGAAAAGGGAIPAAPRLLNPSTWQQAQQMVAQVLNVAQNTASYFVRGMSGPGIPDYVNRAGGYIADSKYVQNLSSTAQIRDFVTLAQTWGVQLYIFVRQGTVVSGPVLQQVRSTGGDIIRIFQ